MRRLFATPLILVALALAAPAHAERPTFSAGVGLNSGLALVEDDSGGVTDDSQQDLQGFTVFGTVEFSPSWGVAVSYRETDGELGSLETAYNQIAAHAVRRWREGRRVRPHVKFGLAHTAMDETDFFGTHSESGVGISFGGGMEIGSKYVAFLLELDSTGVSLGDEVQGIANWTAGLVVRF